MKGFLPVGIAAVLLIVGGYLIQSPASPTIRPPMTYEIQPPAVPAGIVPATAAIECDGNKCWLKRPAVVDVEVTATVTEGEARARPVAGAAKAGVCAVGKCARVALKPLKLLRLRRR